MSGFKKLSQLSIKAKSKDSAEISIYGVIGGGFFSEGITAKDFSKELKALGTEVKNITVRINSPGGDVFEGWTIYNLLAQHQAKITVHVDGLCASIASIIAMAGEKIIMGEGSQMMIHSAWCYTAGNSRDLLNTVERLETLDDQFIRTYANRTKRPKTEIEGLVYAETWFTADEAVEMGLADEKAQETMAIAACFVDNAKWINKAPKNIKTTESEARAKVIQLKTNIQGLLARKK